ncbi:glycosyltransferase family 4 protein [Candidatus Omnitrophota bacterium]
MSGGGAGKSALRLHRGFRSIGVESKMLVLHRNSSDNDIARLKKDYSIFSIVYNGLSRRLISLKVFTHKNTRQKGMDIFTDCRSPYAVSKNLLVQEADIIHLHWIATMVDHSEFFSNNKNKAIVWTLHDNNPFTGGCHVAGDCRKCESGCGACPQLGSTDPDDLSKKIFKRKEEACKGCNIHIVAPSKYLADFAKKSLLFKEFSINVIPNGVSTSVFTERNKKYSRDLLNLPQDKTLLLCGADYSSENKGFKYLAQALKLLKNEKSAALVLFGKYNKALFKDVGVPVYHLGYIYKEELLSHVYSAADMCVMPSLADSFGNVILESMACGTPVVGFNAGGIPELIKSQKTGLLAKVRDAQDLAEKIEWMMHHPAERQQMGDAARKLVEQEYTMQIQARRYLKLYEAIPASSFNGGSIVGGADGKF